MPPPPTKLPLDAPDWRDRATLALALGVLVAVVCLISILWVDRPLLRALHRAATHYHGWTKRTSNWAGSTPILIGSALLLVVALTERWRALAGAAAAVFGSVAGAGIAVNLVKAVFGRYRPTVLWDKALPPSERYQFNWFETASQATSFPSGHAVTAFALATVLTRLTPRWAPLWYAWASVAAAARVPALAHFPSDVLAGAYFGTLAALLLCPSCQRWGVRLYDQLHGACVPPGEPRP